MKKLQFLLLPILLILYYSAYSQENNIYNLHKLMLKEPAKVQAISDKLHMAIYSGKLICYKNNLKDPYSKPEARTLGSKSMTVEYIPNPVQEPDKVEVKDTTIPFSSNKIIGYAINYYKVKIPVNQDEKAGLNKDKAKPGKDKIKEQKKTKVKNKGKEKTNNKADKKEVEMKEELRPAFAPYYEAGDYIYWIRFEDLSTILSEAEINTLKKEFLKN